MNFPLFFKTDKGYGKYLKNGIFVINLNVDCLGMVHYEIEFNHFEVTEYFIENQHSKSYFILGNFELEFQEFVNKFKTNMELFEH